MRLALKGKLIAKEASLRAREQEILEKITHLDKKQGVGSKGQEKQLDISQEEIVQDVRDLKELGLGGSREKEDDGRRESKIKEEVHKRLRIEENEREKVRAEIRQNRRAKQPNIIITTKTINNYRYYVYGFMFSFIYTEPLHPNSGTSTMTWDLPSPKKRTDFTQDRYST